MRTGLENTMLLEK